MGKFFIPSTVCDNGTNSPCDEQSVGPTVWDEKSGDESSGDESSVDEQSPNRSTRWSYVTKCFWGGKVPSRDSSVEEIFHYEGNETVELAG